MKSESGFSFAMASKPFVQKIVNYCLCKVKIWPPTLQSLRFCLTFFTSDATKLWIVIELALNYKICNPYTLLKAHLNLRYVLSHLRKQPWMSVSDPQSALKKAAHSENKKIVVWSYLSSVQQRGCTQSWRRESCKNFCCSRSLSKECAARTWETSSGNSLRTRTRQRRPRWPMATNQSSPPACSTRCWWSSAPCFFSPLSSCWSSQRCPSFKYVHKKLSRVERKLLILKLKLS